MSVVAGYPAEGQRIGPYRVVRRIGGGGMGVVFEAEDESLGRRVALKVIAPHLAESPDFRARFTREAQSLAALDSPHVVHVYTHGVDDGCLYIATQLVPDGDLDQMVHQLGAAPPRVALDLIAQVAAGLADAHAAGLVHRDIKPANVLLRRREGSLVAYLSDFGIARQVGAEHTRNQTGTVGTPSYMAPELHTGGTAGVASDVYSLGCLLWATLSGRAPYAGTSDYEVVSAHLGQPVPQLAGDGPLVVEVNRILRTAMAKDPADRYATAAAMRDDLRRTTGLPDAGTAPLVAADDAPPARSGAKRRAGVVAAVLAVLALVAGGVAVAATYDGGDADDGGGDPTPTASASSTDPGLPTPTDTGPTDPGPTGGGSTGAPSGSDEAKAVASLARALEDQGILNPEQARCTAEKWIEEAGLAAMVEAGFFDEDLDYVDQDRSAMTPEIESAATSAALACATA